MKYNVEEPGLAGNVSVTVTVYDDDHLTKVAVELAAEILDTVVQL